MRNSIESEWRRIREEIDRKIAAAGQAGQIVYLRERDPPTDQPFMYTVGNHSFGLPELLIVDTSETVFAEALNRLAIC